MTKLIYSKQENRQAKNLYSEVTPCSESAQILHLKRILVTLKQHYEKTLEASHLQLQSEQNQRINLQKELEKVRSQLQMNQQNHDEELQALRSQQCCLKELLKKGQDELKQLRDQSPNQTGLKEKVEEANLESKQLREELEKAQKKVKTLEQELVINKQNRDKDIEHFQQLLETAQEEGGEFETVVSQTSSHYLRRELEVIKRNLTQGNIETKALETRYVETLNEKIALEHQCKQLQHQIEHQSSNLSSFQTQLHEIEDIKKTLEVHLQSKENELAHNNQKNLQLQKEIQDNADRIREKEYIQDKYEQLKEEWKQLSDRLDEAIEVREQAEKNLIQSEITASHQETQLQELKQQLQHRFQEKQSLEGERDQLKTLLEESETRLKVAQQHLAKKVKELALLSEKMEEQEANIADLLQNFETQKTQVAQLQASVDIYQRQEKRLQEQLHDALKGNESQVAKWEEKYFHMYDKWQESENKIRDLKKFEEKHLQMQSLLANIGNFMGSSLNSPNNSFTLTQETGDRSIRPATLDVPQETSLSSHQIEHEERYDLFGMRHSQEKFNPNFLS